MSPQTTEERLQTLETMADQVRLYSKVTRHLAMALGRELVETSPDALALIARLRHSMLDDETTQIERDQIEDYLAMLEGLAMDLPPTG